MILGQDLILSAICLISKLSPTNKSSRPINLGLMYQTSSGRTTRDNNMLMTITITKSMPMSAILQV